MVDESIKRHPIRGFLYGIFFGLGLAFVAIGQKWVALGTWPPLIIFIFGLVIGTLWATFGPAKQAKGEPPPEEEAEPEVDDIPVDPAPAEAPLEEAPPAEDELTEPHDM